jgi:hypothetical protein
MFLFIQSLMCLIVPVVMFAAGRKVLKNKKNGVTKGLVYRSRKAKQSQDAWGLGNAIFGRTLMAGAVNVAVISVAFLAVIVWKTEISGWTVALWLMFFQLLSMLIPPLTTEYVLNRTFDDNGQYYEAGASLFPFPFRRKK